MAVHVPRGSVGISNCYKVLGYPVHIVDMGHAAQLGETTAGRARYARRRRGRQVKHGKKAHALPVASARTPSEINLHDTTGAARALD
jgi:hypothetical protein